jgi:predicted enzyme related to lactoylglutathione lyase
MLEHSEPISVGLYARDLEAARRFYLLQLGLPLWREEPREALHFGAGGAVLSIRAASGDVLPSRGLWLVFRIGSGIDDLCDELAERGIVFEQPLADRPFGRSAMFRDPDGHELWVCQPSATETQFFQWQVTRRVRSRPVSVRRAPPKVRRHVRAPPTRRRAHPDE